MSKQLDLLLVNPSARKKIYQVDQEKSDYPALEPPYLAALTANFIRERGFETKILDTNVDGLSEEQAAEVVKEFNPKLIQVVVQGNQPSASTQLMDYVGELCKQTKAKIPSSKILLTGVHPSALSKKTLEDEECDFIAKGEGFFTPLDLLSGKKLSKVSGLWYRQNREVIRGSPDRLMTSKELSENFPTAAWDLLDVSKYRAHDWQCLDDLDARQPYAAIYTSFGCPMTCNFCCINAPFNEDGTRRNMLRTRDPEKVVEEIQMLVEEHGVRHFKFPDEMFVFDKRHYLPIAQGIINRGLGNQVNIWAYARVDTVRGGYLDTLKAAGFNWLCLGIESGNKQVRQIASKGKFGQEDIFDTVRKIESAGIDVLGNYLLGLPGDTLETMQETIDLAVELNCTRSNIYCVIPYPGSQIHKSAQQREFPLPPDWDNSRPLLPEEQGGPGWKGYSQHSYWFWPAPTSTLHPEEVLAFRDKAVRDYFTKNTKYRDLLEKRFGTETAERFCSMNSPEIKRKILGD